MVGPSFPSFSGPYPVGTCDFEFPVDKLESPSEKSPSEAPETIACRIFYPCDNAESQRPVRWIPSPQRRFVSAYANFLGANSAMSNILSVILPTLRYTTIPVQRNAPLRATLPTTERWPVMIFSHGLGGSRNAYSYILTSLASHGIVIIAPDHRDGSSPISYIRATENSAARSVHYLKYSHTPSPEVYGGRDQQLKIRLWEMGLVHDAVVKIDTGRCPKNLDANKTSRKEMVDILQMFNGRLDVHRPGAIIWGGHSFGAATTVQLLKSTYFRVEPDKAAADNYKPLYAPSSASALVRQITPQSIAILLDIWCLPFRSPDTHWLWKRPMPCYAPNGPGGTAIMSIFSEAFYKWSGNMDDAYRVISPPSGSRRSDSSMSKAYMFYPTTSVHLSQSDFGVLFPFIVKNVLKVNDPERIVRLNVRAILQVLRNTGYVVADTSKADLEDIPDKNEGEHSESSSDNEGQDWKILDVHGSVVGWNTIHPDSVSGQTTIEEQSKPPSNNIGETAPIEGMSF